MNANATTDYFKTVNDEIREELIALAIQINETRLAACSIGSSTRRSAIYGPTREAHIYEGLTSSLLLTLMSIADDDEQAKKIFAALISEGLTVSEAVARVKATGH